MMNNKKKIKLVKKNSPNKKLNYKKHNILMNKKVLFCLKMILIMIKLRNLLKVTKIKIKFRFNKLKIKIIIINIILIQRIRIKMYFLIKMYIIILIYHTIQHILTNQLKKNSKNLEL